eukprot:6208455-Pleurochrysis_carterae.AAC.1
MLAAPDVTLASGYCRTSYVATTTAFSRGNDLPTANAVGQPVKFDQIPSSPAFVPVRGENFHVFSPSVKTMPSSPPRCSARAHELACPV